MIRLQKMPAVRPRQSECKLESHRDVCDLHFGGKACNCGLDRTSCDASFPKTVIFMMGLRSQSTAMVLRAAAATPEPEEPKEPKEPKERPVIVSMGGSHTSFGRYHRSH